MFFDINCKNTIKKSDYFIDDFYLVSNREELEKKMSIVEANPEPHLNFFMKLKEQAKKEREKVIKQLKNLLNSTKSSPSLICPTCNEYCYKIYNCSLCNKEICANCLEIFKKFYCRECFNKIKKEDIRQSTLFN